MIHGDLEGLHARFEEQRTLNDRLENDLLRVNQSTDSGRVSGTATPSGDPLAGMNLGRKVSQLLRVCPRTDPTYQQEINNITATPPSSSAETSILPIITSQRDRFRQRNAELEEVSFSAPLLRLDTDPLLAVGTSSTIRDDLRATNGNQITSSG